MLRFLLIGINLCVFSLIFAQNKVDAQNRKQGPWQKNYPNSRVLMYKGQFKDDKPVGVFYYYYQSNKKQAIIKHDENSTRSVAVFYHENGNLMSTGIYHNMKKDSVWTGYGPSGRLSYKETYKDDVLNGKKVIYYVPADPNDKSQNILSISNYLNGKLEGEFIAYFDNGVLKEKGNYVNNKKEGVWISYGDSGKPVMEQRYKNNILHGWSRILDGNGNTKVQKYYYHGVPKEGEELKKLLEQYKAAGKNPNN
jgi:antitoxin component YwqK of YwqJK toxin-antitoxin module